MAITQRLDRGHHGGGVPEGQPGTNVVEHSERVADRVPRFASIAGSERVIASSDRGLGGWVHPEIARVRPEALPQGAKLASRQLWG
jgi:5-methyltetrahydropteroyltriglutamate--homocysteine methyltransferase